MMDPNMQNSGAQPPQAPPAPPQNQPDENGSPIDGIISTVDQFISNPKAITPDTLGQLKMDLEDLKTVLDGGDDSGQAVEPAAAGGLAGMIGGK